VRVAPSVRLCPLSEDDLPRLTRLLADADAAGEWEWFGYRMDRVREIERRWQADGLIGHDQSYLAVWANEELAGWVTWFSVKPSSGALEIGIALFPEHRGHGRGTAAQRQLVEYLFSTTPVNRVQAHTETGNLAEQRALEKAGFQREGVVRGVSFREGGWRDEVLYGITRDDL
jgi:RimJ/RimL family protein N-acetyltransferase